MDELRLILLVIGGLVLAGIVVVHQLKARAVRKKPDWRIHRKEPRLSVKDDDDMAADWSESASYQAEPVQPGLTGLTPARTIDQVVTLHIRRKDQGSIGGNDLCDAAKRAGLTFGEMNIFHRIQEGSDRPVFSVANLVAPGDFNPDDWDHFQSPGLTLFLQLPSDLPALDCWESMLATATRLTELLDAEILDSNRTLLSRVRIGEIREQMRQFDRNEGLGLHDQ